MASSVITDYQFRANDLTERVDSDFQRLPFQGKAGTAEITFQFTASQLSSFVEKLSTKMDDLVTKDALKTIAIRNLVRKTNFLTLCNQFSQKQIEESEYTDEITNHREKYVIPMNQDIDGTKLGIIAAIVSETGMQLYVDDVEELFSLQPGRLLGLLPQDKSAWQNT